MASEPYDSAIRAALLELNAIPGTKTRASCQGKRSAVERSTHADLAYVLFEEPIPLALEADLLTALGDVAQVAADSIYCRWPERNAEFSDRLADSARGYRERRKAQRWSIWKLPFRRLLPLLEDALRGDRQEVRWCLDCGTGVAEAAPTTHGSGCRILTLLCAEAERTGRTIERFLAEDANPPDPRLREREGDRAFLARIDRADFGEAYRTAWRAFLARAARDTLRAEVRAEVAAQRAAGDPVDLHFERGNVLFSRREGRMAEGEAG